MTIISFELTMPSVGSWNGKWTSADKKHYIVKSVSDRYLKEQEHLKPLLAEGKDSWWYSWNDGWGANVTAEVIDGEEAKRRRKASKGFAGYDWMVASILHHGVIKPSRNS